MTTSSPSGAACTGTRSTTTSPGSRPTASKGGDMSAPTPMGGRRVLITGGGAGIGAATARLLVEKGWRVALLDRDGEAARRTAAAIGEARAQGYTGDVCDAKAVEAALDDMVARWGGIDDLINNAGTWDHAPLLELTLERW